MSQTMEVAIRMKAMSPDWKKRLRFSVSELPPVAGASSGMGRVR
jgi:hypothetical protein